MTAVQVWPAGTWATRVAAELIERVRATPALRLVLPTGDTPSAVYAAVVAAARRGEASFGEATVILLDEYLDLDPDDPARCDRRLRRELLEGLDPAPRFVPVALDDRPPEQAAAAHDAAASGVDLALVGLGINGHVGLNEPGSAPEAPTRVVELTVESAVAALRYGARRGPTRGITLGMNRILGAGEVWLLVTGERKRAVLERTLHGPLTPDCPASYLRRHPRLRVLADAAAVGSGARDPV